MASHTYTWNAQGAYTNWSGDWDDWNDDNGDGAYIAAAVDGRKESAKNTGGKGPMGDGTITQVMGYNKSKDTGTIDDWRVRQDIRLNANEEKGTDKELTTSYQTFSENWTSKRPGGGNWNPDDFNSLEMVQALWLHGGAGDTNQARTTYGKFTVTYTPAPEGGGFLITLSKWVGPVIAVASHGLLLREIDHLLRRANPRPTTREELLLVRDKAIVRPKFCFLGDQTWHKLPLPSQT